MLISYAWDLFDITQLFSGRCPMYDKQAQKNWWNNIYISLLLQLHGYVGAGKFLAVPSTWLGGVVVRVSVSWSRGYGFDSQPAHHLAMTLGKLLTPMCLCHQAVQFGTSQRAVMLCGREGNRRSGVALASGHASQTSVVYPPMGSTANEREMSTPPMPQ